MVDWFGLKDYLDQRTSDLPLGIRQRLSLAVAIVHEPEILILDEPTSGVDPLARDRFWEALIDLSRRQGVTIFVSTHFMNEAARCDRISLMDSGRVLATGTPASLIKARGVATLEDAFISYLEEATGARAAGKEIVVAPAEAASRRLRGARTRPGSARAASSPTTIRESLELLRDPIRLGFSLFGTALLMLVFGFGVSTDVNNLSFAVLDHDQSPESRAYLEELRGSTYFVEKAPLADYNELETRMRSGNIKAAIEIPPGFGRDIKRGRPVSIGAWVDGAMPFRAETIRGYLEAMHQLYLTDPAVKTTSPAAPPPADIELQIQIQSGFRLHLCDGAGEHVAAARAVSRHPDGARHRAGKGAGVDRQSLCDAGHPARISARQATSLHRRRARQFHPDVPDGAVHLPGSAQGQLSRAAARRAALCHRDDGLRHADFRVHEDADRRAVRHGHFDRAAGDPIRGHDDACFLARRRRSDHGPRLSR